MDLEKMLKVRFDYLESNYNGNLEQEVLNEINRNLEFLNELEKDQYFFK